MGLDELKQELLKKAEDEAKNLIAQGREEEKKIIKEVEEKIITYKSAVEDDLKKEIIIMEKKIIASSELEVKRTILQTKKELIETVFDQLKQKIRKLDDDKREEHLKKLIKKIKNEIEISRIYCKETDMKFIKDFESKNTDIIGGIIAENNDGTIRIDYSYETILEEVREKYMQEIAKILFK